MEEQGGREDDAVDPTSVQGVDGGYLCSVHWRRHQHVLLHQLAEILPGQRSKGKTNKIHTPQHTHTSTYR